MAILLSVALVLAFITFCYVVYQCCFHPLASIPGPFWAKVTRLWLVFKTRTWQLHRIEIELHNKCGPVVRISPNEVSLADAKYLHLVYGAGTRYRKASWYVSKADKDDKERMNLLRETDIEKYRFQRRLIGPMFTTQAIKQYESLIDNVIKEYIEKMRINGKIPQDLEKWMNILAIDMLTATTFSRPKGLIQSGDDEQNIEELDSAWQMAVTVGLLPQMVPLMNVLQAVAKMIFRKNIFENRFAKLNIAKYFVQQIRARREVPEKTIQQKDLHGAIMRQAAARPAFIAKWAVSTTMIVIGAGFDTMSTALSAFIYYVAKTPGVQAQIYDELQEAKREGRLSDLPTYDEAIQLPFLQACIQEAMRLNPAVGMSLPRTTPPEGAFMYGHHIPGGTTVGVNPWVLHRDRAVFGKDADEFRPERYIEASPSQRRVMEAASLAFGGASRSCPGRHLAWVMLSKSLAGIFNAFELELLDESEARLYGAGFKEESFFTSKIQGVWIRLHPKVS